MIGASEALIRSVQRSYRKSLPINNLNIRQVIPAWIGMNDLSRFVSIGPLAMDQHHTQNGLHRELG